MNLPLSHAKRVLSGVALGAATWLLLPFQSLAANANPSPDDYQIFSGSTHAHTQFTWSHGEQWGGAAGGGDEAKQPMRHTPEGVQLPPASAKVKENWQQFQGPPAEHFARAKATGLYDFYVVSDHS